MIWINILSSIKGLVKHPFVVAIIILVIGFFVMLGVIKHKTKVIEAIKQEAEYEVIKTTTELIHKHADVNIKDNNEINITDNNNSTNFDILFD